MGVEWDVWGGKLLVKLPQEEAPDPWCLLILWEFSRSDQALEDELLYTVLRLFFFFGFLP